MHTSHYACNHKAVPLETAQIQDYSARNHSFTVQTMFLAYRKILVWTVVLECLTLKLLFELLVSVSQETI